MSRCKQTGFTYIGLLIAVVLLGIALGAAGRVWSQAAQHERETELRFIGEEYRHAIASYYRAGGGRQYPQSLADLLNDQRSIMPMHHLRRLYADPMTGAADWTLIGTPALGITGVASSSQAPPLKQDGFPLSEGDFAHAACYCDWKFVYMPRNGRSRAGGAPPAAANQD